MNDWLNAIERLADSWGERLLQASWIGAGALVVACAIARWCPLLSPRVVCWTLRLACLKLIVALLWFEPVCLPLLPATPLELPPHGALVTPSTEILHSQDEWLPAECLKTASQLESHPGTAIDRASKWPLWPMLWLMGFCSGIIITIRQWITIRKLCREAKPTRSIRLQQSLVREGQRVGIRSLPILRISRATGGPLLARCWHPMIVLPSRVEESFDESEIQIMLAHELAHLKRRDLMWNWLLTIASCLFWFHPLIWWMKRCWCQAQEAACDEILIQNGAAQPVEYSQLLLKLASSWQRQSSTGLIAMRMFGSYHGLKRRILAMTHVRAFSPVKIVIAAAILSIVAVPVTIPWRLVAQEPVPEVQPIAPSPSDSARRPQDAQESTLVPSEPQDPSFTEATAKGLTAFNQQDYAQALRDFEEAIRLAPDHSESRRWRGDALLNQGEFDMALSAYEDAIRLDPKNAMAFVGRGIALTKKRELGPALIAYGTAIELDPKLASRPSFKRHLAAAQSLLVSGGRPGFGHPEKEKSPFAAVRWQGADPEIKIGEEWFKLVTLNDIPVAEILDFSRKHFKTQWKMRFEEDLVELLTRMGHPPTDTATLLVQPLTSPEVTTLKDIPMTAANRWSIKRNNQRITDAKHTKNRSWYDFVNHLLGTA